MSAASPRVAILSSTDEILQSTAYTKFLAALNNNFQPGQITVTPVSAKGDYEAESAKNILDVAKMLDATADLIVTLGGLVSAEAAAQLKKHDFPNAYLLIIVGNTPKHGSALEKRDAANIGLLGGVDLESTIQNPARANALMQQFNAITDRSKICLYYNNNSHMWKEEQTEWMFHVGGPNGLAYASTVNQKNYSDIFANDFGKLPNGTQAVVISSDPFFASKAGDLAKAANGLSVPVCYPSEIFQTTSGKSISHGASLQDAYAALGAKANQFLVNLSKNTQSTFLGFDVVTTAGVQRK